MSPQEYSKQWEAAKKVLEEMLCRCSQSISTRLQETRVEPDARPRQPADDPEEGHEEVVVGLMHLSNTDCRQIRHALAHGAAGDYGICEFCREQISDARLKAMPHATRCIGCQNAAEGIVIDTDSARSFLRAL